MQLTSLERLYEDTNFTHCIIDGDAIVYRAGFGAKEGEPVEHALHNAKNMIQEILDYCAAPEYRLFIGGKGNFRDIIATVREYKGNRKDARRPEHYEAIREYLCNAWAAEKVDGMEADDACGITQCDLLQASNPILVHIDKDLKMIPGWHYNWVKKESYFQDISDADAFFWNQALIGDSTDNIPGIAGIGKKKAEKMLEGKSVLDMEDIVRKAYNNDEAFREQANLLWILREPPKGELRW